MNYKEMVQEIYPNAKVYVSPKSNGNHSYIVWNDSWFENRFPLTNFGRYLTHEKAWEGAWEFIQELMCRKLES